MKTSDFLKQRTELLNEQAEQKKQIDAKCGKLVKAYIETNSPYKKEQVVVIGEGKKAKRMVIFQIEPLIIDNHIIIISLYGWYLDADNKPIKWEGSGIAITGISNPKTVALSDNQTWYPVEQ